MKAAPIALCSLALGCLVAACQGAGTAATATATIVNYGSSRTAPFQVAVNASGRASSGKSTAVKIPKETTKKFFADVRAAQAKPSPSGAAMCMKTLFSSVVRVKAGNWTSVDLGCPVVGANAALKADVDAILAAVHLVPPPRRMTLPPNEPRRLPNESGTPHPTATP